jgi:DNA-binding transcriptional LysR family regulator
MLELSQVACFIAIVEEGTFSQAADRLGVAQSVVSQRLRRLEDQLGIQLLERTSRSVKLSQAGLELLPFAQQLLAIESRTCAEARRLRERVRSTLRLGGYAFSSQRRARLIEGYLACNPSSRIEVEYASRDLLMEMLRKDQIDAFLCLAGPEGPLPEFDAITYSVINPYVSFPAGGPLATAQPITLADLRGLTLAISPGRQEIRIMEQLTKATAAHGITLLESPEAERSYIAAFALARCLPVLHWLDASERSFTLEGFTTVAMDEPSLRLQYFVYTNRNVDRPVVVRLRASMASN